MPGACGVQLNEDEVHTMKPLLTTLATLAFLTVLAGCSGSGDTAPARSDGTDSTVAETFHIKGTLVYKDLEGGFFALESDDGNTFTPVNLPEAFRKDGLKVKVSALPYEGMSIHMHGTLIEIVEIAEP